MVERSVRGASVGRMDRGAVQRRTRFDREFILWRCTVDTRMTYLLVRLTIRNIFCRRELKRTKRCRCFDTSLPMLLLRIAASRRNPPVRWLHLCSSCESWVVYSKRYCAIFFRTFLEPCPSWDPRCLSEAWRIVLSIDACPSVGWFFSVVRISALSTSKALLRDILQNIR